MWQYNHSPCSGELCHHGIKGQKWGVRRYQNADGSLTDAGRKHYEKKDVKWADKNYDKIYKKAYKKSEKELNKWMKSELNPKYSAQLQSGKISRSYVNEYNKKLATLMSTAASEVRSPSGRTIQFVAKRGEVGVHMALADSGYDMSKLKNGVWTDGRVAYKKEHVDTARA